jgi:phage I-like protein
MTPTEFLLLPMGKFSAKKLGGQVKEYLVDEKSIKSILSDRKQRGNKLAFDYEHQAMSGSEAPAAGWCDVEARNDGIWAVNCQWTDHAKQRIEAKEYAHFSPTFVADKEGRILELHNVALTNQPATLEQKPLIALTALEGLCKEERDNMDKEVVALLAAFGAPSLEALKGTIEGLKASEAAAKAENERLKGEVVTLKGEVDRKEKEALVAANSKKITPAMKEWALSQTIEALNGFLKVAPEVVSSEIVRQPTGSTASADEVEKVKLTCKGKTWEQLSSMEKHNLYHADKVEFDRLLAESKK